MLNKFSLVHLALAFLLTSGLTAQTTGFTYQGHLEEGGRSANGSYDFKITVKDAPVAGSAVANSQIVAPVGVTNGLFVLALDFGATAFSGANRWLEIGVRTNGSVAEYTILAPLQSVASSPYAIQSINAQKSGTAEIANSVALGAVGSGQLANGAAKANLEASGQSGVASGGIILSVTENSALLNSGYIRLGAMTGGDAWLNMTASGSVPSARYLHTAVWTGTEMLIWGGGFGSSSLNDGGRYNPVANTWTPMTTIGAPSARIRHTAIWTGNEMIVWGGVNSTNLTDGGSYNPTTDTWVGTADAGAPVARRYHTAVWTGSEMIIWGGFNGSDDLNDGGRYNPITKSWTGVSNSGSPGARQLHTAVWTGSEMIVWGGYHAGFLNNGGRYNPIANAWNVLNAIGSPGARSAHSAIWTGSEMLIWGGFSNDAGRYNPNANTWNTMSVVNAPSSRADHTAVWTGTEMIVWGGRNSTPPLNDGGRYNVSANSWTSLQMNGSPSARVSHTSVWTGKEMIVFGGAGLTIYNDVNVYTPSRIFQIYQRP